MILDPLKCKKTRRIHLILPSLILAPLDAKRSPIHVAMPPFIWPVLFGYDPNRSAVDPCMLGDYMRSRL